MAVGAQVLIKGGRGTGNITSERRVLDISKKIHLLDENNNPLVVFTKRAGKQSCFNPEFKWQEDQFEPKAVTIDATAEAALDDGVTAAFSLPAGEENYVIEGDLIILAGSANIAIAADNYDEIMLVTVVAANGLDLTVVRNFGGRATAWAGTPVITSPSSAFVLGSDFEEGALAATARSTKVVIQSNFTQIFKDALKVTGTEDASELYGGGDRARERRKKGMKHMRDIERQMIQGQPKEITTGTHPQRQTGGVRWFIQTNVTNVAGTINYATFENFAKDVFRFGNSDTRLLLVGGTAMSALDLMAANELISFTPDTVFGVSIKRIVTGHGDFLVVRHKQFDDMGLGGEAIALDMEDVRYRFLRGRDTRMFTNIQEDGEDAMKDQFLTECGLQFPLEETSGRLTGITGFAP